jgi:c-di-AMP phosphodiesterase-like protein
MKLHPVVFELKYVDGMRMMMMMMMMMMVAVVVIIVIIIIIVIMIIMMVIILVVVVVVVIIIITTTINTRYEHGVKENIHKFNKLSSSCNIFKEIILELNRGP